jgi:hypothetical protein
MLARGVCIEAEILMKRSPKPGKLLHTNGDPITIPKFARLTMSHEKEVTEGVQELLISGEFTLDKSGVITSPRLLRQAKQSAKMKAVRSGESPNGSDET